MLDVNQLRPGSLPVCRRLEPRRARSSSSSSCLSPFPRSGNLLTHEDESSDLLSSSAHLEFNIYRRSFLNGPRSTRQEERRNRLAWFAISFLPCVERAELRPVRSKAKEVVGGKAGGVGDGVGREVMKEKENRGTTYKQTKQQLPALLPFSRSFSPGSFLPTSPVPLQQHSQDPPSNERRVL